MSDIEESNESHEDNSEFDPENQQFFNYIPSEYYKGELLVNENSILNGAHHLFAPAFKD